LLIERPQDVAPAKAQLWLQNAQGITSRWIEYDELHEMEPALSEQVQTAVFCPHDGIADHTATTRGLAAAAQKLGAVVREQTAVASLEQQNGRITAVTTRHGERIPVGKSLLLLSNHHVAPCLSQHFGVTLPLWPMLPQVMFTEKLDPMPIRHLIGHAHRTLAMKNHPSGQIMISGGWRGKWNEQLGRGETQPDQVAGNLAEAVAVYPTLAGTTVAEADASRRETISVDGIPIIDQIPGIENGFFGAGWSGHGWAIAPTSNQLLAEWVWSGAEKTGLLRPFSYQRFYP
jgi:sarcosine oxidase subunit beta